ncbi:FAS-associated factor 2 [Folsomia candida]|uniref:FAS-associated factor 2-B n=1 Tax=Folsomia candida TaxID=158441 RepID=A0A226DEJ1_FOLCA|nr:FAS-associated factor 2 [Folsomia candida]XP_021963771.1 FAS-associated factor 2 [Folsomia candida]OXA42616.1 FAS-associated factor 2-B [Folsomia candida]
MGSTNNQMENANIPPEENNLGDGDAVMELILEFQAVSGMEDMDESRRILERHNWDLLSAISSHLGFENAAPADHIEHQVRDDPSPPTPPPMMGPGPSNQLAAPGGRPNPGRQGGGGLLNWVWALLTRPMEMVFQFVWDVIGFGLRFLNLRTDPRRAITNPVQDIVEFLTEYEAKFGTEHPNFYQGSYGQALADAKKELKFLLVYLHCKDHLETDMFCRNVMPNRDFNDFVRENMLFWACSVSKPEGYRTSQALRENTYPFLALIVLKNNRMTIVKRIEGETDPSVVLPRLHQGVADNEAFLVAARQDRYERNMTQHLRQQQDEAYLQSLKADQEKEKRKQEELKKLQEEEMEKQRKIDEEIQHIEDIKRQKKEAGEALKMEPPADHPDTIRTIIKLPNGTRLERRFLKTDSLSHLYQFVFSHAEAPNNFDIATNFPKRSLPCKTTSKSNPTPPTFMDVGLGKNEMLFVYDLES